MALACQRLVGGTDSSQYGAQARFSGSSEINSPPSTQRHHTTRASTNSRDDRPPCLYSIVDYTYPSTQSRAAMLTYRRRTHAPLLMPAHFPVTAPPGLTKSPQTAPHSKIPTAVSCIHSSCATSRQPRKSNGAAPAGGAGTAGAAISGEAPAKIERFATLYASGSSFAYSYKFTLLAIGSTEYPDGHLSQAPSEPSCNSGLASRKARPNLPPRKNSPRREFSPKKAADARRGSEHKRH